MFKAIICSIGVYVGTICVASADDYPKGLQGAWGWNDLYGQISDNIAVANCRAYAANPQNPVVNIGKKRGGADLVIFANATKWNFNEFTKEADYNASVKTLGDNHWRIVDKHFGFDERGSAQSWHDVPYEITLVHKALRDAIVISKNANVDGRNIIDQREYQRCNTSLPASASTSSETSGFTFRIERVFDGGHPNSEVFLTTRLSKEEGDLKASFNLNAVRGFLGPSNDPNSSSGIMNAEHTIFAVNNQPVTKSSYVHFFIRTADGDLIFSNNVNDRIAKLLDGRFSNSAKYFLRAEAINGRTVHMQTVDFSAPNADPMHAAAYDFDINIDDKGAFSLLGAGDN